MIQVPGRMPQIKTISANIFWLKTTFIRQDMSIEHPTRYATRQANSGRQLFPNIVTDTVSIP